MNNTGQFGLLKLVFVVMSILLIWAFFLAPMFAVTAATSNSEGGLFAFVVDNYNMLFLVGLVFGIWAWVASGR